MDYNGGTELWKHQWEFIRDPQNIWFAWAQEEGEGEMMNPNMSKDEIKSFLETIHYANENNSENLDLTTFQLSKGECKDLSLEDYKIDFLKARIGYGKQISDQVPIQTEPLIIEPNEINRVYCDKPEGVEGKFERFYFYRLEKSVMPGYEDELIKSNNIQVEIIIKDYDADDMRAYLFGNILRDGTNLGDPVPYPYIAPIGTDTLKGKFGCTREGSGCKYDNYSSLTNEGREKSHDGIDIYASVGTPVHAIYGGKVVALVNNFDPQNNIYSQNSNKDVQGNSSLEEFISTTNTSNNYNYYSIILDEKLNDTTYIVTYKRGMYGCHYKFGSYGNYVIIESTNLKKPISTINGSQTDKVYILYGHLNDISISIGQKINKGDIIGKSGCSGNAARIEPYRYHIHIEASSDNDFLGNVRDINPATILNTIQ